MSVFTPLRRDELEAFLAPYGLGRLHEFQGIASGTENSNFFVSLERGEYVLTLVERGPGEALPFMIELLDVLHRAGLPVPYAIRSEDGEPLGELAEKPALLQPRLPGHHVAAPNPHHCAEVGRFLARLHLATGEQTLERSSDRGLDWMQEQGPSLALGLPDNQLELLREALAEIAERRPRLLALPRADLHADLFRDNVLFEGNHLSGVIDFYNACSGPMLYDLAIAVNDWCSHPNGELDHQRVEPLLAAYSSLRRFTPAEAELWPTMLRVACLRFWLSRLIAQQQFAGQAEVQVKDPDEFCRLLAARQQPDCPLPFAF
ncbi:homoserine kinase [Stutzerimonas balearica]|jgi:homoserine kinase type II|uniref:homoserine kinase n=1 Tax=Stutzerimonas balearica TaxID=74829 RepID=UPI000C499D78|nr:homoserine kinase [Stutzerimonas balearica]MBB60067.1 homoserine kinase [Pseudomonas sp.]MBS4151878.1 homoserine kinase [Stutzerimonas balearica]MCF6758953.1 homoserine kinase [Stutzerimonas balearica]QII99217.1 homoserine kinase [Stutzerimonas balearica]HAF93223.1 homoserine kinase [Pseudomonas sp.]